MESLKVQPFYETDTNGMGFMMGITLKKIAENGYQRWVLNTVISILLVVFALGGMYSLFAGHVDDNAGMHLTENKKAEFIEMKGAIDYNTLDIRRVETDYQTDLKELKIDMNRGFDEVKQLIRNGS